jgi:hypothetical protein
MYRDTGGAPVANSVNDGSHIDHPDIDTINPK